MEGEFGENEQGEPVSNIVTDTTQDEDSGNLCIAGMEVGLTLSREPSPEPEAQEVKLEFDDPVDAPLGVSAEVVQVGEETIETTTTEEIVEEVAPENAVPEEVTLKLDNVVSDVPDAPVSAKPVEEPKPKEEAKTDEKAEISMTQAPAETKPEPQPEPSK